MIEIIKNILYQNPLGVFSFFIIGVLLVILVQNIFFYLSYKDNAYLWYSSYALIILCDQVLINYAVYFYNKNNYDINMVGTIHPALEWLYNSAYIVFVVEFGGRDLFSEKTAKKVKKVVLLLTIILAILFLIDINYKINLVRKGFNYFQVPMLVVLSSFLFYHLFKMKTKIKYYIIPGSMSILLFSLLAFGISMFSSDNNELSWGMFYIGVFIENLFFSLGLVAKQKIVLKERNDSQQELIIQLQENEELKSSLTEKLQEEVTKKTSEIITLNEKAETERIKQIEVNFEKEIAQMKVSSLQSQMNPHFIFNSLNSIKLYIIKNDKDNAVYYLNKFSKLIRKILSASREKEVSLQEELDTVELYANIENIRFKNKIQFSLNVDDKLNLSTIKIPPLILQPFIENAIWHGLSPKEGLMKLDVNISKQDENFVIISVIDNGIGRKKSKEIKEKKLHKKESVGLKLTEERLSNFSKGFKNSYELFFTDLTDGEKAKGTKVTIKLPLR